MLYTNIYKSLLCSLCVLIIFSSALVKAETSYKVKPSDTLTTIIKKHYKKTKLTKSQLIIGVLAENPHAFRRGNINALKSHQQLTLPDIANLKIMDKEKATALIAKHYRHFRKRSKKPLDAPFAGYTSNSKDMKTLLKAQQEKLENLKKLEQEREALRIHVDKLLAEKEQMDAELQQLNNQSKQ